MDPFVGRRDAREELPTFGKAGFGQCRIHECLLDMLDKEVGAGEAVLGEPALDFAPYAIDRARRERPSSVLPGRPGLKPLPIIILELTRPVYGPLRLKRGEDPDRQLAIAEQCRPVPFPADAGHDFGQGRAFLLGLAGNQDVVIAPDRFPELQEWKRLLVAFGDIHRDAKSWLKRP